MKPRMYYCRLVSLPGATIFLARHSPLATSHFVQFGCGPTALGYNWFMDMTVRKYTSHKEAKADEYRYWQSRPVHERMDAVEEITLDAYAMKGVELEPDVPRLQRPLVRLQCPWR